MTFVPPGRGEWMSLHDHFPRAVTPEYGRLLSTAMTEGEAIPFAAYGMPATSIVVGLVHGHVYIAPLPLIGRASDAVPPRAVLWAASRLLPVFRRRHRAARAALAARPWLVEADHWYATERAEWYDASAALQVEEPGALDDAGLVDHLRRARAHADAGYRRHFSLHGPDLIPTGLLLARCEDWGIAADRVLQVLAGASPASLGRGRTLDALRAAVAAVGTDPTSLDDVRAAAPDELDHFLAEHGSRLVSGYDLDSVTLAELPALVVTLIRAAATPSNPPAGYGGPSHVPRTTPDLMELGVDHDAGEPDDALERLLAVAPTAHRGELEQLVADARATFGVRDDNGALTAAWPVGLLRRAMLEAGHRLVRRNALDEAAHAVEVTVDELIALLEGSAGPSAAEVTERAADRRARSALAPPSRLGPTVDIPLDVLPAPMAAIARAQLVLRDTFVAPDDGRSDLTGEGLGDVAYTGRACVAADPIDALTRLEPGDVLVAVGTTPAYNMALSVAGAVVVEEGGLLSHAAVIARELGRPAVIGAAGAVASIPDGALIEVDPLAGRVRVLAPAG